MLCQLGGIYPTGGHGVEVGLHLSGDHESVPGPGRAAVRPAAAALTQLAPRPPRPPLRAR